MGAQRGDFSKLSDPIAAPAGVLPGPFGHSAAGGYGAALRCGAATVRLLLRALPAAGVALSNFQHTDRYLEPADAAISSPRQWSSPETTDLRAGY
jgi:hypothetical protein